MDHALLAEIDATRADLHRYCARMLGSVTDGEDLVQEALLRAYDAIDTLRGPSRLRPWLFRIAHNLALDRLKSYEHRNIERLEAREPALDASAPEAESPDARFDREQNLHAALSLFLELAPTQRSALILKDVLDNSLEEIAALLSISVPAVQSALHRGRTRLQEIRHEGGIPRAPIRTPSADLERYARAFNARDWDAIVRMLAEDVELDVVSGFRRQGRTLVTSYFSNYAKLGDFVVVPGWLDQREALAYFDGACVNGFARAPRYFIEVAFAHGEIVGIRDFRHVPYIAHDARFEPLVAE